MKIQICAIRKINRAIAEFETEFEQRHSLSLNEAMLLCILAQKCCSSGSLAECLGLSNSNTSKVIRSVEKQGLIIRQLGTDDKRQMFFILTDNGKQKLKEVEETDTPFSPMLQRLIESLD